MPAPVTLDSYMAHDIYRVHGWMKALDAQLIAGVAEMQSARGWGGSLAEIGVHHGKLFFLLALSRQAGEHALAMDLFEDDEGVAGQSGEGRDRAFFDHARRLGVALGEHEVMKGDSTQLTPADITGRVGRVRLFSVDGGHLYHHVESDLALADQVLTNEGVVVIDDFCSAQWPEVTFAAYDYLRAHKDTLAPALLSRNKLYVCRPAAADAYRAFARDDARFAAYPKDDVGLLGSSAVFLRQTVKSMVIDQVRNQFTTRFAKAA